MTDTWHFFDIETGLFAGRTFTGEDETLTLNTPEGLIAVRGVTDPLSQRFDMAKGLVDYQPPPPSNDHLWDADAKRWTLHPDVQARQMAQMQTLAKIAALEDGQHRAIREATLGNTLGIKRLLEIEAQIKVLRGQL